VENGVEAEFDGVVTEVSVVEGATPAVGTQLLKLESTEDVYVKITVTKYDLDKIAEGQQADITIGSKTYQGQVSKINKMAEKNQSGAAVVGAEITILNPDSDVYLGVEAKVVIHTAEEKDTLVVPVSAVNVDLNGEFIYVAQDNVLVRRPVETGISSDTMIQILDGIEEGELMITEVTTEMEEGMAVTPVSVE
jgi:RND family efflux transporter MFP subunit